MRSVSRRLLVFSFVVLLGSQSAFAAQSDRSRAIRQRIKHFITVLFDQLGSPPG